MASQGAEPVAGDWRPPLEGYAELVRTRDGIDIDAANGGAVRRICTGRPMLVGMGIARDVIPGFAPAGKARLLITHSGPPITWSRMCGPTRGAIMGALNATLDMCEICAGEHTAFTIPPLNFRGTPVGIDVRKVMRTGITPWLNTGIAHSEPGIGTVGAWLVQAQTGCLEAAFEALRLL